jgi:CRP-like cAMP-binding protein
MEELNAIRAVPLFDGISESQLQIIFDMTTRRGVAAGTTILQEGEHSYSLFVLLRGEVDVTKRLGLTAGASMDLVKDKTIVRLAAPQFFGEMALLGDAVRTATVVASTECDLLEVRKGDFDRLVEEDLLLAYRLLHNIAEALCFRLRRTDRDVLKLTAALSLALGNR